MGKPGATDTLRKRINRRKKIATIIVDEIMRGYHGQAERLVLEVNGKDDGGWGRQPLIDKIVSILSEESVD